MIPNHKGEVPVVLLLLPFLSGILVGLNLFSGANISLLIALFVFLSVVFITLNLSYNRLKLFKVRWLGGSLMACLLFLFGWIIVGRHSELNAKDHFSKFPAQHLVVRVNSEPASKSGYTRFIATVDEAINKGITTPTSGTLLVAIKDSSAKKLNYGNELLIPAKYSPIDPPFNPAEFNYKQYMADKNTFYQAFLYPKMFKVVGTGAGNPIIAASLRLRQQFVEKLKRNLADTGAIAVASTLILGYKADLSRDTQQAYSKTGTMYVLSVSGAQVAILYLLLTYALSFLNRFKYGKIIKAIIIISLIWYYALLTGCSIAVCRAALMLSMVLVGKTFNRYINTLNLLAFSAFVLLCYDPFFITEVGFQLSYLAVSGLLIFEPLIYGLIKIKNQYTRKLWKLCSLSIAAQLVIFPLSAFYFHQFPVYFLISNLFIIIPSALIMYVGVLFLLLPQIPLVSKSLALVLEKTIVLTNRALSFIESLPYASIDKIWITRTEYALMYSLMVCLFYFLYHKKVTPLKLGLCFMLLLCISFGIKNIRQSQSNSIAWLNLNKHQGIVFKNGDDAVVLSDLKKTDKAYLYSIQPYLDSCGVDHAQLVDLNHDINTTWLKKRGSLVQFLNTTVFIFNGHIQNNLFVPKVKTNYIYVMGGADKEWSALSSNFDLGTVVIDGSNSAKAAAQWETQATAQHFDHKILRRNNSFVSVSN